jgi:hypothetical protein
MYDRIAVKRILLDIQNGKINPNSAMALIKAATTYAKGDREAVMDIMDILARGPDGVSGTSDDIPESTLKIVRFLLDSDVLYDIVTELRRRSWCCL